MHAGLKITSQKADLASFTELSWHHPGRNEENHDTSCGQHIHQVLQKCLPPQPACLVKIFKSQYMKKIYNVCMRNETADLQGIHLVSSALLWSTAFKI